MKQKNDLQKNCKSRVLRVAECVEIEIFNKWPKIKNNIIFFPLECWNLEFYQDAIVWDNLLLFADFFHTSLYKLFIYVDLYLVFAHFKENLQSNLCKNLSIRALSRGFCESKVKVHYFFRWTRHIRLTFCWTHQFCMLPLEAIITNKSGCFDYSQIEH